MTDIEFCREFVKRIPRPSKTLSNNHMIKIVENGEFLQTTNPPFTEKQISELYHNSIPAQFVYNFIVQNQNLFCK